MQLKFSDLSAKPFFSCSDRWSISFSGHTTCLWCGTQSWT